MAERQPLDLGTLLLLIPGLGERLYTDARRRGVHLLRYYFDRKPTVEMREWAGDRATNKELSAASALELLLELVEGPAP